MCIAHPSLCVLSNAPYFIFHHAHSPLQFVPFYAEAAQALDQSVNLFMEIGRLSMAARYCKVKLFSNLYAWMKTFSQKKTKRRAMSFSPSGSLIAAML
jgi:hypothetical protein